VYTSELETSCEKLFTLKENIASQKSTLREVELEVLKESERRDTLLIMAEIRGETRPHTENDKLSTLQTSIRSTENEAYTLEKKILTLLKDFMIPVTLKEPEIAGDKSVIVIEGKPYVNLVKFIASILGTNSVKIDNVELDSESVTVTNVTSPKETANSILSFRDNIRRLARVSLGEKDDDIEEVVDKLHSSVNRPIWEALNGKKETSIQDLVELLKPKDEKEKRKIKNFFTNLELVLKDKYPFIDRPDTVHELSFFGTLIWTRYKEVYLKDTFVAKKDEEVSDLSVKPETDEKQEPSESKKSEKNTLNGYFNSDQIKDTLYGEKVE
jgi:hypothetical protein